MNDKENDIIYTAQDIEAYVSGSLTAAQMHAMEKAALDDSFLAEAMEGYGMVKSDDWKNELAALKTTFENKEERKAIVVAMPKRNNNWWKVAAAVVLLAGAATISYLVINKNDQQSTIAKNTPAENKSSTVDTKLDTSSSTTNVATTTTSAQTVTVAQVPAEKQNNAAAKAEVKNEDAAGRTSEKTLAAKADVQVKQSQATDELVKNRTNVLNGKINAERDFVYKPQNKAVADSFITAYRKSDTDDRNAYAKKSLPATTPPVTYYNNNTVANNAGIVAPGYSSELFKDKNSNTAAATKAKEEFQLNHNFKAQVFGADNTPLPFANVSIKNENFGTYADVKGNFSLVSTDSILTVEVKAAGYQPKFYTLQSYAQQNKIVLAEDNDISKYKKVEAKSADVASRSKISRRATLLKDSVINVEPADGWDNYNTYVNNNIEIPEDILTKDIHGQVELSFDVKSNGTIANIKVDKSLCDNCDELAKKMIQQGPQWKLKKGKKGKGKVTVQF